MGFELWGVEYLTQGRYSVLKIFIDSENGIDVDDCASVSRQVGSLLDVEEPLRGQVHTGSVFAGDGQAIVYF